MSSTPKTQKTLLSFFKSPSKPEELPAPISPPQPIEKASPKQDTKRKAEPVEAKRDVTPPRAVSPEVRAQKAKRRAIVDSEDEATPAPVVKTPSKPKASPTTVAEMPKKALLRHL